MKRLITMIIVLIFICSFPSIYSIDVLSSVETGMSVGDVLEITKPSDSYQFELAEERTMNILVYSNHGAVVIIENGIVQEKQTFYEYINNFSEFFEYMLSIENNSTDKTAEFHDNTLEKVKQKFDIIIRGSGLYTSYDEEKNAGFKLKFKNNSMYPIAAFEITVYFYDKKGLPFYEKTYRPMSGYSYGGPEILKPNYSFLYPEDSNRFMSVSGMDIQEWKTGEISIELTSVELPDKNF